MALQSKLFAACATSSNTHNRYSVQSRLLEYLSVWQEKQSRTGLSISTLVPGKIHQAVDTGSFS